MVPKQFLKLLTRKGYGRVLFYDWRYLPGEVPNPEFVLNLPRYQGASILLARANFGCGSSREHAPWGSARLRLPRGDRAEFCGHFLQQLSEERHPADYSARSANGRALSARAESEGGYQLTVDLPNAEHHRRRRAEDSLRHRPVSEAGAARRARRYRHDAQARRGNRGLRTEATIPMPPCIDQWT